MIKCQTLGMLDIAKVNPVLTHTEDVKNYSILTLEDKLYLIANSVTGDACYSDDYVIKKGEFLNGFLIEAWNGQKLIVDGKHIEDELDTLNVNDKLEAQADGGLKKADSPTGTYFKLTKKGVTLTGPAVEVEVVVASGE